jgi:hypothetical protein
MGKTKPAAPEPSKKKAKAAPGARASRLTAAVQGFRHAWARPPRRRRASARVGTRRAARATRQRLARGLRLLAGAHCAARPLERRRVASPCPAARAHCRDACCQAR